MRSSFADLILLLLLLSSIACGCSNDSKNCLENTILISNECDQTIMVSYYQYDDSYDLLEELLNIAGCDVEEKNVAVPLAETVSIEVFLGSCTSDEQAGYDSCSQFISEETITVQYGGSVKEYFVDSVSQIVISQADFE